MFSFFWIIFLLEVLETGYSMSAKIVGFSAIGGSHYLLMRNAMEELASRGHEVMLALPSAQKVNPSEKVTHRVFQVPYETETTGETISKALMEKGTSLEVIHWMNEMHRVLCECLLNDTDFLDDLRDFDLIVHDSVATCPVLVAELLNVPRVEIEPVSPNAPFLFYHMVPMPVSYVPQSFPGYSDKMTFLQRVINLGAYIFASRIFMASLADTMNGVKYKYNIKPERSFQKAIGDAELLIINANFALEYPQPLLPGNIMVGPLTVKEPLPLSQEYEEFVNNSANHGFIIVSFGSGVGILSVEKMDKLVRAFGKLKQKVVWRVKFAGTKTSFASPNIKIVDWLPQNDLLGHKDIKAFVSHVGQNSLYESVYHGVPVVAFPLFFDQFFNARKVEHFGLGLSVDPNNFEVEELVEKIEHVINNPRFKAEATRISKILKDGPRTPVQTTGDWIEYVLRHGGARHLRAQVFNIPWYQYYLLDVVVFLVAVVTLVVMVIRMTCQCLCRLCSKRSGTKSKEE